MEKENAPDRVTLQPLNVTENKKLIVMYELMYSNWLQWVLALSVKDFAFIFHRDRIKSGLYANIHGMSNAFYTRYKIFTNQAASHVVSQYESIDH